MQKNGAINRMVRYITAETADKIRNILVSLENVCTSERSAAAAQRNADTTSHLFYIPMSETITIFPRSLGKSNTH